MTETNLALPNDIDFGSTEVLAEALSVSTSGGFLPRLQVVGQSSKIVAEAKEGAKIGTFAFVKTNDNFVTLGPEVEYLALTLRSKAMIIPDGANPIAYYDVNSDEFKKVRAKADEGGMNGNMYGSEFLIWLPSQDSFGTFYCSNKTLRRIAPDIIQLMKSGGGIKPASIRSRTKMIKGEKYTWWGCDIFANNTLMPPPTATDWVEQVKEQVSRFRNPPKSEVEPVEAGSDRPR